MEELINILTKKKGNKDQIVKTINTYEDRVSQLKISIEDLTIAQGIVQEVATKTQKELEYRLSDLCTLALKTIFEDPYEFKTLFEIKRGQTECKLMFERNGIQLRPLKSGGWGAADVAGFGLRIAMKTISRPVTSPLLILDEPFKHLKGEEANIKAIQLVKEIADKLNIQIIMVSDERVPINEIEKGADMVFSVKKNNDESVVSVR